jgi:hypothetical protein
VLRIEYLFNPLYAYLSYVQVGGVMGDAPRFLAELTAEESLRLLGNVSLGRIVFTMDARPASRPFNHIVDDGAVVIRSTRAPRS